MLGEKVLRELENLSDVEETAFIGLGNRDKGDDAVGLEIIDRLSHLNKGRFYSEEQGLESSILGIMKIKDIHNIIFIDACDLDSEPGEICLVRNEGVDDRRISTHKHPISLLMALLEKEGKKSYLLGIQPESVERKNAFSESVSSSCKKIIEAIERGLEG